MKQYKDLKKLFKSLFIILGLILLFTPLLYIYGETLQDIQNKISQKNNDIDKLEAEIKSYQKELVNLGSKKNSLSKEIKELDLTRKKLNADIKLTENKIEKTNLKIQSLDNDIYDKNVSIDKNIEALIVNLKQVNEYEENTFTEKLLQINDLSSIWNDLDNMDVLKKSIISNTNNLKNIRGELEDTKSFTLIAKSELESLKSKLADQKKIVEENSLIKIKLLKQTKNSETNYQKLVKEQTLKKNALEKELRDFESKLKYILDPKSLPGKGVLSWPLDNVYVTQLFGKTSASARLYTSGSHSGVDFRASVGTPVKSVSDGKVIGFGDTDITCPGASFGKWILVEHNNGLSSAYGHLSLIKVSAGQNIERGQIIGYSGNSGHTTGPHLHVTIYASKAVKVETIPSKSCSGKTLTQPIAAINAYLDPMYYFPKY